MSEYEYSPRNGQADAFDQHDDGHLAVPNSRDPNAVYSRHRDVTWITTSQVPSIVPQARPPSRPLPTPVIRVPSVVVRAPSEELDAEYMTVDPEEDFEIVQGSSDLQTNRRRGGAKNFVGGFVSGLRKLPRAVLRNRVHERKPVERGSVGIDDIGETTDHYQSPRVMGPRTPDVLYVETAEMPGEYPEPSDANSVVTNGHPDGHNATSTHSHFTDAPVAQSNQSHFTDAPAAQSSQSHFTDALGAQSPRSHITNDPRAQSRAQSRAHSPHSVAPDISHNPHTARSATHEITPYDARDPHDVETGETTMVHDVGSPPDAADSPVYVEPRPASDYDKMPSPIRSPSVTSLNSRFVRVGKFFQDLYDLPWVATRITADYIPSEQSRARYRKTQTPWYSDGFHSRIDLLAGGQYTPPHRVHSPGDPMPDSSATLAYYSRPDLRSQSPPFERTRSPLYTAHQNRSRPFSPHEGQYAYPHGYAPEYAGQPLYAHPSASPQPQMRPGFHSNSVSVAGQGYFPERQYRVTPSSPRPFVPPSEHMPAPPGMYYPHPMSRAPTIRPAQ